MTAEGASGSGTDLDVRVRTRVGSFDLDVAFRSPAGVTALFGPSGAGKTLTLRAIAGLDAPVSGRVTLNGRVLLDREAGVELPARERRIGYLFQHQALFPHLDVAGNVGFGLRGMTREAKAERVARLLALTGMEGFGTRRVTDLSGGERQRVALARALAPEPELLLLDEPFTGLDDELRRRLHDELLALQRRTGVAMLLVTHDAEDVEQLAERVVRIRGGRIVAE